MRVACFDLPDDPKESIFNIISDWCDDKSFLNINNYTYVVSQLERLRQHFDRSDPRRIEVLCHLVYAQRNPDLYSYREKYDYKRRQANETTKESNQVYASYGPYVGTGEPYCR